MHKSRLAALVIDCQSTDFDRDIAFWSQALGHPATRGSDPADAHYADLAVPPGEPRILLQRVEHPSRVHLDIESDDIEAEVTRLEGLGARRLQQIRTWWVMEAPSGHRFCVVSPSRPDFAENAPPRG
jgi:predicted enzyme related to lactoylglutathione lyase